MPLLEWSNNFSVGVSALDAEHKKLVEMINLLHEAMKSGKGKDVMDKILDDAANYTLKHFASEERLMQQHQYPGYNEHKQLHAGFAVKITDLRKQYGEQRLQSSIMLKTLQEWLTTHICEVDKKYGPYLSGK